MKTKGETVIPQPFELTPKTLDWLERKYPGQINVEETLERFEDWARQKGVMYADWQAGFKTVVRKGMDNGWRTIVTLSGGRQSDPQWQMALHEARKFGFREPTPMETPASYKTALDNWKRAPKPNVLPFANVIKRVAP